MGDTAKFTIEPCILVRDRISVDKGVSYVRRELTNERNDDGSEDATWQTDRHYENREEASLATRVYNNSRNRIRTVCLNTDIGFVCPMNKVKELERAVTEAQQMVDEFNETAECCRIRFLVVCTDIEPTNVNGVQVLKETLEKSTKDIVDALSSFNLKKASETLRATKTLTSVLADPDSKRELAQYRDEVKILCKEVSSLLKEYDGNIKNAQASDKAVVLMKRVNAAWRF